MTIPDYQYTDFDKKLFKIGDVLDRVEQGFNIPGSFPVIAIVSGVLRAGFGTAEIISGIALGLLFGATAIFCKNSETAGKLRDLSNFSFQTIEHGVINIYRGLGAEALATGILAVGMFAMLSINMDSVNGPFMPYQSNRDTAEDVINNRVDEGTKWYSPLKREKERIVSHLREELNLP